MQKETELEERKGGTDYEKVFPFHQDISQREGHCALQDEDSFAKILKDCHLQHL